MALFGDVLRRQVLLNGQWQGSLRWLLQDLEYSYEDEITTKSSFTGMPVPPRAVQFTPDGLYGNLLAMADEMGALQLLDTRKPLIDSQITEVDCHSNSIFDISWVPGGTKMMTASGDLSVCLWDVTSSCCLRKFHWHKNSVKSVDVNQSDDCVFVSSGRDGNIAVWDTRCSIKRSGLLAPANCIYDAHKPVPNKVPTSRTPTRIKTKESSANYSVTSVLFLGSNKIASTGAADGLVKVWDLRKNYSSSKTHLPRPYITFDTVQQGAGFSCLVVDSKFSFLYATCTDGNIYKYRADGSVIKPIELFSAGEFEASSFYVRSCLSFDDNFLLSGSTAGKGFIWEIDKPKDPPLVLPMISEEVTNVAWCPTALDKVALCIEESGLSVWRGKRGRRKEGNHEEDATIEKCREAKCTRKRLHSIENRSLEQISPLRQKRLKFSKSS